MPENKAAGLGKLIHAAAPDISNSLIFIVNFSLQSGKFISEWKHAQVLPHFKSGSLMETINYRQISILPILSKLLERYVHTCFSEYLETHNLLIIAQSSFRRLHWLKNIDEGLVTGVVFIDLQKAFDTFDVDIILAKLTSFGIRSVEHKWFQSYQSGRSQSISVDGHLSDPLPVSMGVPQGSILGPLLFLLFLNDLPSVAESCGTNIFANDAEIDTAEKPECREDLQNNLNADLHKIKDYLIYNRLSLNISK